MSAIYFNSQWLSQQNKISIKVPADCSCKSLFEPTGCECLKLKELLGCASILDMYVKKSLHTVIHRCKTKWPWCDVKNF